MTAVTHIDFPYGFDGRGRTADSSEEHHVRDLIEQVLFTAPGERVNRPDFGSGLLRLLFEPTDDSVAASARAGVQSSLQRWLGDRIQVESVQVRSVGSRLEVVVQYVVARTQERRVERFHSGGAVA